MTYIDFKLKDGDIFLYHGTHIISNLIRRFDGTEVNHASLYIGDNQVIEATSGVTKNSIDKSIKNSTYIKVFRLNDEISNIKPVTDVAKKFYSSPNRYGYEQILLLAFIILIKKAMPNKVFKWIAKTVLERAAEILLKLTQQGKEVLICSELVFRSYEEPYPDILKITNLNTIRKLNNLPSNVDSESLYALFSNPASKLLTNKKSIINAQANLKNIDKNQTIDEIVQSTEEELKDALEYLNKIESNDIPDIDISEVETAFHIFANQINKQFNINEDIETTIFRRDKSLTINNLNKVIADFVTPGDLYKSNALKYIGKITKE